MDLEDLITILLSLLVICIVLAMPMAAIWALNTLFTTAIAYTFKTWAAAMILMAIVAICCTPNVTKG